MPNKNILFITYFAANEPLLCSRTTPVLREMSKAGFTYHLVTFEKRFKNSNVLFMNRNILKEGLDSINVKWYPLRYHKSPLIFSTFYDIFIGIFRCISIILFKRIDYIHAQTSVGGAIALPVARLFKKKFVYDINGLLAEEYADAGIWKRDSVIFRIVNNFEKMIIFFANGIIPLSEKIARKIVNGSYVPYKKSKWNFQVIPSHVDMGRFILNDSKNVGIVQKYGLGKRFVLIYVGSIGTWYMLEEMLDFFKIMSEIISNSIFLILSHVDKEEIFSVVRKKNIGLGNIIVSECLPEEMPRYLSTADAAIFFIKPVFSKEACSPIKFGEYLASGLPLVINKNVGDTEEIVKDNNVGVVVENFTQENYKKAALSLKELIDKDKNLKHKCRETAQKFLSLEMSLERYKLLYKEVFILE